MLCKILVCWKSLVTLIACICHGKHRGTSMRFLYMKIKESHISAGILAITAMDDSAMLWAHVKHKQVKAQVLQYNSDAVTWWCCSPSCRFSWSTVWKFLLHSVHLKGRTATCWSCMCWRKVLLFWMVLTQSWAENWRAIMCELGFCSACQP